jgi:hypothetical protein
VFAVHDDIGLPGEVIDTSIFERRLDKLLGRVQPVEERALPLDQRLLPPDRAASWS